MTTQRYALLAAVGAIYAIVTALLVGAEGRSYRKSLHEARAIRAEIAATVTALRDWKRAEGVSLHPPNGDLRSAVAAGSGDPRRAETEARGLSQFSTSQAPDQGSSRVVENGTVPSHETAPAPSDKNAIQPSDKSVGPTVGVKPASPPAVALNVPTPKPVTIPKATPPVQRSAAAIWADSLDLATITPEDETRLGGELNQIVRMTSPVDRDGDVERLRKSADPLLKFRTRPEIAYTFTILDSEVVNAFSLPGGFIYVSKGLFNLVGEDMRPEEDYTLQFALGHEIAHVDLKHTLKLLAPGNAAAKKQGMDTLNQCLVPVMVAYPDAMEFEADAWAYERMTHRLEPPRTQREAWMFLIKFEGFAKKHGFRNGRMALDPRSGMTLVENHYRAHPAAWERLDRLKTLAVPPAAPNGAKSR